MNYLNVLKRQLRVDPVEKDEILRELSCHLEDKIGELRDKGMTELEAIETASNLLGSPDIIARQIYEIYSQGSWKQTIFAIIPHFLTAMLFILHWRTNLFWLTIILFGMIGAVIYGWCHGKPTWLFSWLGFLLVPVIVTGVMLVYLPGNWSWVSTLVYIPLAVFILVIVARRILKIDWLFVSLMLLPIPIVIGWLIVLDVNELFFGSEINSKTAWWIALSFAVIGLAVATFIRVRQRWMKAGALFVCSVLVLIGLILVGVNSLNFWTCLFLSVLMLLHLFLPALLERKEAYK